MREIVRDLPLGGIDRHELDVLATELGTRAVDVLASHGVQVWCDLDSDDAAEGVATCRHVHHPALARPDVGEHVIACNLTAAKHPAGEQPPRRCVFFFNDSATTE